MNTFSAGAMIRAGWETFKKRPWFFVGVELIILILSGVASQMSGYLNNKAQGGSGTLFVLGLAGLFLGIVLQILIKMGAISFSLKAQENPDTAKVEDLWAPAMFWQYLLASIVVGAIIVVGLILLIVPGIMWALRLMFVPYLVIDRGLDVRAALKESSRITNGHKWELLLFLLMIAGINIIGAILLLVGLLVSIPVTMFALAHAYRTLAHSAGEVVPA